MTDLMPHWLTKQADLAPHKLALQQSDGKTYTFNELSIASQALAQKLASLGIGKQTKVAILAPNNSELVILIHALSYLNAVAVMLNTRLTKTELNFQLESSQAILLLTTEQLQQEKQLEIANQQTFEEVANTQPSDVKLVSEINLTDPFTMMFTSGTTGRPKAVIHTYKNHWSSAIGSVLNLGLHAEDKWLLTLPIFHIGGFSILMRSVIYGMSVYLLEKYDAKAILHALKFEHVTIASLVTMMLQQVVDELADEVFPESCRCILLGGGSVDEHLLEKVAAKKIPLFQSYGMTETSSQIATLNIANAKEKLGSAGKALFPAEIKIAEPNEDKIGEILVKGPMVMTGYYNNHHANQVNYEADWFKTGDLGYFDSEGFLFVVDRRTDLIISGGENIYPSEIEQVIKAIPGIKEVVVVGKQDKKWGQVPVAFIVIQAEMLTAEVIYQYTREHLARFKVPHEIHFIKEIPRNATNKILRHKLGDLLNDSSTENL